MLREGAEDAAVVGGVDAEAGRAGADQAGAGQAGQQRVGGDGADRAGAVDDGGDAQLGAVVEGDVEGVGRRGARRRWCRGGAASRPAVAIGVEARARSTGAIRWRCTSQVRASSAMKRRLSASDRPRHSWAVTGRRPSIAARQSPVASTVALDVCVSIVERSASRSWVRVTPGGGGTGGSRGQHVGLRARVVARDDVDGAARAVGADREVDHRQARAEHQHVADLGDRLRSTGRRRAAGRRRSSAGAQPVPGLAARGEHDGPRLDALAVGELDDEAGRRPRRCRRPRPDGVRAGRCRGTRSPW